YVFYHALYFHAHICSFFFSLIRPHPISPLFPYTTLFRSRGTRATRRRCFSSSSTGTPTRRWPPTPRRSKSCCPATTRHRSALPRSEEHTSELQSPYDLVCRLLLEKKKKKNKKSVHKR